MREECSPRHSGVQSLPPWPAAIPPPSKTSKCAWVHMYSAYNKQGLVSLSVQVGMSTRTHPVRSQQIKWTGGVCKHSRHLFTTQTGILGLYQRSRVRDIHVFITGPVHSTVHTHSKIPMYYYKPSNQHQCLLCSHLQVF